MKKYWQIFKISWQNSLVYRFNFLMWQVRSLLSFLTIYFFWFAVFTQYSQIGDYNRQEMLAYVLVVAFLRHLVLWTDSFHACVEIANGDLNNYLIKPINYFGNWLARDWSNKVLNIIFLSVELAIIIFILRIPLIFPVNFWFWIWFIFVVVLSSMLYFFYSFVISGFSFWYPEHDGWPLRFLMMMFLEFLSGAVFPLDIFSQPATAIFKILPTSYFIFFPAQVYLGKLNVNEQLIGLGTMLFWLLFFIYLTKVVWKKGLQIYGAYGR